MLSNLLRMFRRQSNRNSAAETHRVAEFRKLARRSVKLHLEELEKRIVPTAFYWDPTGTNFNVDATTKQGGFTVYANWDQNSYGSTIHPVNLPKSGDTIYFNGANNNPCNLPANNANLTGTVILYNGYNSLLSLKNNATLTMEGFDDQNSTTDSFNLGGDGSGKVVIPAGNSDTFDFYNFNFSAIGLDFQGGYVWMGEKAGLSCLSSAPMTIDGGIVNVGPFTSNSGYSTVTWKGSISVYDAGGRHGVLNFVEDTTTPGTLLDSGGSTTSIIQIGQNIGGGELDLLNPTLNNVKMTINVPIQISGAAGEAGVFNAIQGGSWYFTGKSGKISNYDVYNGPSGGLGNGGTLNLGGGATLEFKDGIGGSTTVDNPAPATSIVDNSTPTIITDTGAASNLVNVNFTSPTGFGDLGYGGSLVLGGNVNVRIDNDETSSDGFIPQANASLDISNANLFITVSGGALTGGEHTWVVIASAAGAQIVTNTNTGDWASVNPPAGVAVDDSHLPNYWQLNATAPWDMSAAGFGGSFAFLNGTFNLVWNDTDGEYESTQQTNSGPTWTLYDNGDGTWTLVGSDYDINAVSYVSEGTFNPDGPNTFDFVSAQGDGTYPSTLTITLDS